MQERAKNLTEEKSYVIQTPLCSHTFSDGIGLCPPHTRGTWVSRVPGPRPL